MKNSEVQIGSAYCYAPREPSIGQAGTKVTVLAWDKVPERGRQVTMARVRLDTDEIGWTGRLIAEEGTEKHVPARQLWGEWDERIARVNRYAENKAEAERLQKEIIESLVALGVVEESRPRVFGIVGSGNVGVRLEIHGANEAQKFADALSFALSAHG